MTTTGEWIWLDGELVPWSDATTHVMSTGLQYGVAFFEGMRSYSTPLGPAVFRMYEHLERWRRSAHVYGLALPYDTAALAEATRRVVATSGLDECYIRPIAWLGHNLNPFASAFHVAIGCWVWNTYIQTDESGGVKAKTSSFRRIEANSIPPAAKAAGQYLNSWLAKTEAIAAGCNEAILLNAAGYVSDGSAENVFVVRDGVVVTPPLRSGALAGVTRDTVMILAREAGLEVVEDDLVRTDLYLADEVFLTGTASEIAPVTFVDGRKVGGGSIGAITRLLHERFDDVVHGRDAKHLDWCTVVGRGDEDMEQIVGDPRGLVVQEARA